MRQRRSRRSARRPGHRRRCATRRGGAPGTAARPLTGPAGHPAHRRQGTDPVTATLLDLAVRGHLRVEEQAGRRRPRNWTLVATAPTTPDRLAPHEEALLQAAFAGRPAVSISLLCQQRTRALARPVRRTDAGDAVLAELAPYRAQLAGAGLERIPPDRAAEVFSRSLPYAGFSGSGGSSSISSSGGGSW